MEEEANPARGGGRGPQYARRSEREKKKKKIQDIKRAIYVGGSHMPRPPEHRNRPPEEEKSASNDVKHSAVSRSPLASYSTRVLLLAMALTG